MHLHLTRIAPFALLAAILSVPSFAEAQRLSFTPEEMKNALKTARPEEDGFIDDVVDRVNNADRPSNERLPASMVESTFQWARSKNTRHRFQYFRRAMIIRAAQIGVRL
ncbi:MAG: hypothetical protein RBS80_06165 [Thermoguttaceae bacterium]|jgi:hypothetical protein|nr:hypothetical protein [Thermoguttaceae bacterium]